MRLGPIFLAASLAAFACSARAQTALDAARDQFEGELSQQCPAKQLQMLSPRDLRDGLDDYKGGLTQDQLARLQQAELAQCSSMDAGVACVNLADIAAAGDMGDMTDLAATICTDFLRCRDQGACDHAR
jgi:nucleoside 2-deoxyribosyltransferase